jgi:RNA polymerase sigma factor (sigma-70 family)
MSSKKKPCLGTENLPNLISRAKSGDQNAFTALYEATSQEVYATVRSMVRTEELALDIQQDSYVFAFTHLDQLVDPAKFRAWIHTIAVNRTRSVLRRQTPLLFSELDLENDPLPELPDLSTEASPELSLDRKETTRLIREILDELTDGQRMLVGMYYYEQMPVGKIAQTLEVTPGTVKKQLSRARKKIESAVKRLEEKGVKLYGLSPLPFLLALLRQQEPAAETGKALLAKTAEKAGLAAGAKAAAPAAEAVAVHVGRPFFETALGKLILGVVSVSVIGGGILGYRWIQAKAAYGNTRPSERIAYTEHTTDPVVLENIIPTVPESYNETPEDLITEPITTESVTEAEPTEPASSAPERPTEPRPTEPERPTDPQPAQPPTEPEGKTAELVSWHSEYSAPGSSVLTLQTYQLNSSVFITVNVRGDGEPTLISSNPAVSSVSQYREKIPLENGLFAYRWAVCISNFGTADLSCVLNGVSRVIARTDMPEPEPCFLQASFLGRFDSGAPIDAELQKTETLSVKVQGFEAPEIQLDTQGILSVSGPAQYRDEKWNYLHEWKLTPVSAGTVHITVKFGGSAVKTFTVIVSDQSSKDDSCEDLDDEP